MLGWKEPLEAITSHKTPRGEALVGKLAPLVAVPRLGVEQFVKLRSDDSVEKLEQIIGGYSQSARGQARTPRGPSPCGSQSRSAASTPAPKGSRSTAAPGGDPCQQSPESPATHSGLNRLITGSTGDAAAALAKFWKGTGTLGTSHRHFFSARQGLPGSTEKPSTNVFDEIWRPNCAGDLADWQGSAADADVECLANSLRGLKYVSEKVGRKNRTEHRDKYVQHKVSSRTGRGSNERNLSQVPIGSIYSTDPWEIEAAKQRESAEREKLEQFRAEQEAQKASGIKPQTQALWNPRKRDSRAPTGPTEVAGVFKGYVGGTKASEYRGCFIAHEVKPGDRTRAARRPAWA